MAPVNRAPAGGAAIGTMVAENPDEAKSFMAPPV
jgi:hypothetical protein